MNNDKPRIVNPEDYTGCSMSFAQLWGSGPKFTIICGWCTGVFKQRIPMIDYPRLGCPFCGSLNELPLIMRNGHD